MTDVTLQKTDALQVPPRRHRSLWGDAWRRLIASPTARLGMGIVLLFLLSTLLARLFWPYDAATDLDYSVSLEPPIFVPHEESGTIHPFGTDKLGRDIFRRVVHGGWNSLRVGLVAVSISLLIGSVLGFVAGFYESVPLTTLERVVLSGGIGLTLGVLPAWIARQPLQLLLFTGLGITSALLHNFLAGRPERVAIFAAAGLLLGALPALLVSPYTAIVCGLLGLLIGGFLGLSPGGSLFSNGVMRTMDIILAFPTYLLAIAIVAFLGPGLDKGMIAIGFVGIPVYARLTRSTVLSVIQKEYILAAQAVGAGHGRILLRHVASNSLSPLIVQATMGLAGAILSAAALGFLGLGAIPPEPEWGAMLGDSYQYLTSGAWWAVLFPGLAIMLSVLGFNLLGDGLRDALDPRLTR
jgi:ABC-type dipeptide/oligopeptide/nickel transport system permease subunit